MATGMREKTTNVGGVIKRIWYAMTDTTQGPQLLSLDESGNLEAKLLNPVINGTATGTATTTTGENGKLVKTSNLGNIAMTQTVDGNVGVILNNTSTGVNANTGFQTKNDMFNYLSIWTYGSGRINTLFGKVVGNKVGLLTQGADNTGLLIGTLSNAPITVGINSVAVAEINSTESAWSIPLKTTQLKLSALNTAPASASATGTTGDIRIDANYIYVCTATNTWKRTALTTW